MAKLSTFTAKASPVAADYVYLYSIADLGERRTTIGEFLTGQTLLNCALTNPTMSTPTLGVATATSLNGVALSSTGTAALVVANGKTVTLNSTMTLAAGADGRTFTFPSTSATIARTDAAQTFTGTQTFGAVTLTGNFVTAGTIVQTSSSTAAFASGPAGNSNPVFRLVNNIGSSETGISITGRAAAAGVNINVLSSGTNESLHIDAKGSGEIQLNETATGNIVAYQTLRIENSGTTLLQVGSISNPNLLKVTSVGSHTTGITLTGRASGLGFDIVLEQGSSNENLRIDSKGTGSLVVNSVATGAFIVGPVATPVLSVTQPFLGTGISIESNSAASGVALAAISSGTNENLKVDAKGSGTITLNGTATGNIVLGRATTGLTLGLTGAATLLNATAVPATAGAVAAGTPLVVYSNGITIECTTDAPTHARAKGSICININGSSTSTRMYVNTNGSTTWTNFTTAA